MSYRDLYRGRRLSERYPELERQHVGHHAAYEYLPAYQGMLGSIADSLGNLLDLTIGSRRMLVIGCGPQAHEVHFFAERGYDVTAVEPVAGSVELARASLGAKARVELGSAEALPCADGSHRVVVMVSVLEHVDSPARSLAEAFRVLEPGGVLFVYTTNRWRFSWRGYTGEYSVRFINWFPAFIREAYVFHQLHYRPEIANYNPRPAFHWFTYHELCMLGRSAGFGYFYSMLDLVNLDSPWVATSRLRRFLLERVRYSPWLRGLALTQAGASIFMVKRDS